MTGLQTQVAGRRVLVLGLGRFTGGVETVRYLVEHGARVVISDSASRKGLEDSAASVEALGAELLFGPQTPALLEQTDLVIANPAIPFDHEVLRAADARGLEVTTETNLLLERLAAPVLAVTGTKGKSTTATLLAGILRASGRTVHLGGNVGRALLAGVDDIADDHLVVLELSSFQLHWARRVHRSVSVAVITNLFGDHLDRHGTFEHYARSKRALLDAQGPGDRAVLPVDDDDVRRAAFLTAGAAERVTYGDGGAWRLKGRRVEGPDGQGVSLDAFPLWGAHNRRNALAAVAAAFQVPGIDAEHAEAGLAAARPLPHRLAPVAEVAGVLYVDDSNATNPTSTRRALEACPRPAVVLIGGKSKGLDVAPLLDTLLEHAHGVVGIGTTGPDIVRALEGRMTAVDGGADMASAVRRAAALARPGDAVLLSPAFASFDRYPSFVARGRDFQSAVAGLPAARPEA